MSAHQANRPFVARTVRLLAVPIIIFWALFAVTTNTFVPKVEDIA
ncbi:MAG: putative drug exporter of the superfamily, partial [Mycobacterium sp.]|nr:putative drug exporter of the superfamily [Mycobacterium sp.]